jgi:dTDP-4-dehydrorhamnose reductase
MDLSTVGVTGAQGRIGSRLVSRGMTPLLFDITKPDEIIIPSNVQYIIHCAAYTDVNLAEKNVEDALKVNVRGTANIMDVFNNNENFLLISSDHVFDTARWGFPSERSKPNPLNVYGFTKYAAETYVRNDGGRVVRTSFVFDTPRIPAVDGKKHEVPSRITKSFMFVDDFVDCLIYYVLNWTKMPQLLHVAGSKNISWYTFARECAGIVGVDKSNIIERTTWLMDGFAPRPQKSGLNVKKAISLGLPIKSYKEGLERWQKFHSAS